MKSLFKFTVIVLFLVSLIFSVVLAQTQTNCKIAWPQFGTVECKVFYGSQPQIETKSSSCTGNNCIFTFSCAARTECEISPDDITLKCPPLGCAYYTLTKDGTTGKTYSNCPIWGSSPEKIDRFTSLTISGSCKFVGLTLDKPFSSGSSIVMTYQNIYLYEGNPDQPVPAKVEQSVGCVPQGLMTKYGYTPSGLPSNWVDSNGNHQSGPSYPIKDIASLPTNLQIGDTYSYFYRWTEVPGINAIIGKDGNPSGYCGGTTGNRILLSYSQISDSVSGGCYIVPTSSKSKVECCYNEDCKWKDPSGKFLCDPTTFTCTDKVSCDSDVECQVPWQSSGCVNKIDTSWKCDLNQKWYPKQGTCVMTTRNVPCCTDNDCSSNKYCDKENGCQDKYILVDCPSGKCCKSGGNYKPKDCESGLQCCSSADPIIGDCKTTCEPPKTTINNPNNGGSKNPTTGEFNLGGNIIIGIVIVIIIAVGVVGYIIWKNKQQEEPISDKKESKDLLGGDV